MQTLITVVHVSTCFLLVLVVLIQSGKGAEISASFAGSSQTVFGSSGGANFFTRFTSVAAAIFFATSVTLTILGGQNRKSLFEVGSSMPPIPAQTIPSQSNSATTAAPPAAAGAVGTLPPTKTDEKPVNPSVPGTKQ